MTGNKDKLDQEDVFVIAALVSEFFHNSRLTTELAIRNSTEKKEQAQRFVEQVLPINKILKSLPDGKDIKTKDCNNNVKEKP